MNENRDNNKHEMLNKRQKLVSAYPILWNKMIREWRAPRTDDAVWLMYSANYLFNTGGKKWAVDPVLLSNRIPESQVLDVNQDLADLDFIILSHAHRDHTDVELWIQLERSRCHWIVPEHMVDFFTNAISIDSASYSIAVPGKEITVAGVHIVPFEAPHYELLKSGERNHVDSTGYFIETANASYLFPCDIRTYDPSCLEKFKDVSAVFAHVFLGRSAAAVCNPPLLNSFVDFYLSCHPKMIVLSHLYELGRDPEDCWLSSHGRLAAKAIHAANNKTKIAIPEWFKETVL